jgi:hypothetical protein
VGVVKFGDKHGAKVVHGLHQPLSDDAAAHVLSRFSFDEVPMVGEGAKNGATNRDGGNGKAGSGKAAGPFESMLRQSLATLREAKSSRTWQANTEALQLLLIVSDGRILGEHQQVQRLVREAAEEGVLPVLVLLDYFAPPGSVSAAKSATVGVSRAGGSRGAPPASTVPAHSILDIKSTSFVGGKLKISSYIDDYPLPYYILLRDMHALPTYLGDALRQWFELVAGNAS